MLRSSEDHEVDFVFGQQRDQTLYLAVELLNGAEQTRIPGIEVRRDSRARHAA